MSDQSTERTYSVLAIHCDVCATSISDALAPVDGIEAATVDLGSNTVRVRGTASDEVVRRVLTGAGYPPA